MSTSGRSATAEVTDPRAPAPPHAPLLDYYATPEEHSGFVRATFNRTAKSYDRINAVFALGSGRWYRRRALQRGGLRPGARYLDMAIGTGMVAREAAAILGDTSGMTGLDLSEGMMAVARQSLPIPMVQARAEELPFADASFDFISMGYALRHVNDLGRLFAQQRRVLRPGGRLLLLEIAPPASRLGQKLAKAYLGGVVPLLSRLAGSGSDTLMRYCWDTIEGCVPPRDILWHLQQAGLINVHCSVEIGIMRAYSAQRPLS
ncbi:class I SAM-dependent methyltransferase [Siccirubricoccus sp. KC 17139]|uniref:Class I SAM-dependent methyltransferase n=1 Tax=Siccirubricoccus soli TaxID=2899147 RepID=A0ABT1D7S8_9PROT|nr:class I SAM-dependent methyltransferase [Siccirubricoccus soli]MCO6417995.1 class I SAM-dependent methyltransferase [Siccirubricoccus soli]MCP2684130.1 class I SAM-dependent methyltransferase [Siccirubricoccus soli]